MNMQTKRAVVLITIIFILCCALVFALSEPDGHNPSDQWDSDVEGHWHNCTDADCTEHLDFAPHAPAVDDGDCSTAIKCTVCERELIAGNTHDPSTDWQSDVTGHWHTCRNTGCTVKLAFAAHTPNEDDGDCTTPILCSVCGAEATAAKTHDPSSDWQSDAIGHWHTCKNAGCTVKLDYAAHTPNADDGDCTTPILCSVCNAETTAARTHVRSTTWQTNDDYHWFTCCNAGCGAWLECSKHSMKDDDNNCLTALYCRICNKLLYPAAEKHVFGGENNVYTYVPEGHNEICCNETCIYMSETEGHKFYQRKDDSGIQCSVCGYRTSDFSGTKECYAEETSGSSNNPIVWTLRAFRDNTLAKSAVGRLAIKAYYAVSPALVNLLNESEWFMQASRRALNSVASHLQSIGYTSTPYDVSAVTAVDDGHELKLNQSSDHHDRSYTPSATAPWIRAAQ